MIKGKLYKNTKLILFLCFICCSKSAFADININDSVTSYQKFTGNGQKIKVGVGGDLHFYYIGREDFVNTILSNNGLRDLQIEVDSGNAAKGVRASGEAEGAINLQDIRGSFSLNVKSGIVESYDNYAPSVFLKSESSTDRLSASITVSSGASIVSHNIPAAIYQLNNTDLVINNSGSLVSNNTFDASDFDIISGGGGTISSYDSGNLTINNYNGSIITSGNLSKGSLASSSSGIALNLKSNNAHNAINNNSGATINGSMALYGGETVINNSGAINGDIVAHEAESAGASYTNYNPAKITLTNNGGAIFGNIIMGSVAGSSFTLNSGSVTGNLTGNTSQTININGGSFNGNIAFKENLNLSASEINIGGNVTSNSSEAKININSGSQIVGGNFTLRSGNILALTLASNGSVGNLTTSGIADLPSGVKLNINIGNTYSYINDGAKFDIIKGGSGSTVNAISNSNIDVNSSNTNKFSVLTFSTTASNNDTLTLNVERASAASVSNDSNIQGVYNSINEVGSNSSGEIKMLQQYIDTSSSKSDVESALKSVMVQSDNSIRLNSISVIKGSIETVENRLDNLHFVSLENRKIYQASKRYSGVSTGDLSNQHAIWGQTFGTKAKQSNVNGDGYASNSLGFAFGVDKAISKNTRLGAAVSYADSAIKSADSLKTTNVNTYQINAYGGRSFGHYFVDGVLGFALNDYNSSRNISVVGVTANSNYQGQSYTAKVRGGFVHNLGNNFNVTPEVSANFVKNNVNGYVEKNAGTLNLKVNSLSNNFFEGRVGAKLGYDTKTKSGTKISPTLSASYGYNFLNKSQTTVSNFVGQTATFNTISSKVDPRSIKVGGGIDIYAMRSTVISVNYVADKRKRYLSHSGFLRVRYEF
jgi:outer membrane autotransporter protein